METTLTEDQRYIIGKVVESFRFKLKGESLQHFMTLEGWQQACLSFGEPLNRKGMRNVIHKAKRNAAQKG